MNWHQAKERHTTSHDVAPREIKSLHATWRHTTWYGEIMSHQVTWCHSTFHNITPRDMNLHCVSLSPRYMAAQYVRSKQNLQKYK